MTCLTWLLPMGAAILEDLEKTKVLTTTLIGSACIITGIVVIQMGS